VADEFTLGEDKAMRKLRIFAFLGWVALFSLTYLGAVYGLSLIPERISHEILIVEGLIIVSAFWVCVGVKMFED
jgi:hypothetical protein